MIPKLILCILSFEILQLICIVDNKIHFKSTVNELNYSLNSDKNILRTNETAKFFVIGNNSTVILMYGDNITETFHLSCSTGHVFNHSYSLAGNFKVQAIFKTSNNISAILNLTYEVIVQNAIEEIEIIQSERFTFNKDIYKFWLEANTNSIGPSDVFCSWNLSTNFAVAEIRFLPELSIKKRTELLLHNLTRRDVGKNINLHLSCWNLVSSMTTNHTFSIFEEISNLTLLSTAYNIMPVVEFHLNITMQKGSNVTFVIDFNDTTRIEVEHPLIFASETPLTLSKFYNETGNYTVVVEAKNPISKGQVRVAIVVQNRIKLVNIICKDTIYWPPGNLNYSLELDKEQEILEDISCNIQFSNGMSKYIFVKIWPRDRNFNFGQTLPKSSLGILNMITNCSNTVSEVISKAKVLVRLDVVIIRSIIIVEPILVFNLTTFILEMDNIGDRGCLHIQFGNTLDERTFGLDELCEDYSKDKLLNFTKISKNDKLIRFQYRYENEGVYYIAIRAFNHLGSDLVFKKFEVKNWYCFPPKINVNKYFLSQPDLFKTDHLELFVNLTVFCSKTSKIDYYWKLVYLDTNTTIREGFNETLLCKAFSLNYGHYAAFFSASMNKVEETTANASIYFQIVHLPLNVSVEGGSVINVNYSDNVTFKALVKSDNMDEISFEWFCKLSHEQDNITNKLTYINYPPNITNDYLKSGGCFGTGPGKLPVTANQFTLNTAYLDTKQRFLIRVRVSSPSAFVDSVQELIIETGIPVVNVICMENCGKKSAIRLPMVFAVDCLQHCSTMFDEVYYKWRLFEEYSGGKIEIDLQSKLHISTTTTSKRIEILENSLKEGVWHYLEVEGRFLNKTTKFEKKFLRNKRPFGGSCNCEPRSGFASITNFMISCQGWLEYDKREGSLGLKYEYKARPKGTDKSFLLFFSYNQESVPLMLPVGNPDKNFLTEAVITVRDSVGDQTEFLYDVEVTVPNLPEEELLNETMNIMTSNDITDKIKNGSFSQVASSVFSVTSILNVNLTSNSSKTDDQPTRKDNECKGRQRRMNLRGIMVNHTKKIPFNTADEMQQNNGLIDSLASKPNEVDIQTQNDLSTQLTNLNSALNNNRGRIGRQVTEDLSVSLIQSGIRIASAANSHNQEVKSYLKGSKNSCFSTINNLGPTETPPEPEVMLNDTQTQVGVVMREVVAVIHNVSDELLDDKRVGDGATKISLEDITLELERNNWKNMSNQTYSARHSFIEIPSINKMMDINDDDCIKRMLLVSTINPYIWDASADRVKSSVAEFRLESCKSSKKEDNKKLKETLNEPYALTMDITKPKSESIESKVKVIHSINVTQSGIPLILTFEPLKGNLTVSFTAGNLTNATYRNFSIPQNISCTKQMNEKYCYEYLRTLVIDQNDNTTFYFIVDSDLEIINYNVTIFNASCNIWNGNTWHSDPTVCNIDKGSTPSTTRFKSNIFGSLGAGLDIKPNLIDFDTVFLNFGSKLADNAAVFSTICCLIVLLIPLVILARRLDIRDEISWKPISLIGNQERDSNRYEIHVFTGKTIIKSSNLRIYITLYGTEGNSGQRILSEDDYRVESDTCSSFMLTTPNYLGQLVCLKIGTVEPFPSNTKLYLSKIIIIHCSTNNWSLFTHEDWLSFAGLINEELLLAEFEKFEYDLSTLLIRNTKRRFADDHLWLSIGTKRIRSIFTRLQRLITCFVALFLSMIASCMFYRNSETSPKQSAFTIGPYSFTVNEVYVSFASSIVVVPGLIVITSCFNSKRKRRFCVIFGWTVAIVAILSSAFFTILYSIQWGKEKSVKWLVSFVLSFFESFILLQPIKVFLIVIFLTFILKQESDLLQYETGKEKLIKLQKQDLNTVPKELKVHLKYIQIRERNRLKKLEKNLENRMRKMIFDIFIHSIYFTLLVYVCFSSRQVENFYQNQALSKSINNVQSIKSLENLNKWLSNEAIPTIYQDYYYNTEERDEYDKKFIQDLYQMRFSPPKLIQERFMYQKCRLSNILRNLYEGRPCIGDDKKSAITNFTNFITNSFLNVSVISLGDNNETAQKILRNVNEQFWFDRTTSKVILEVIIMNNLWMSQARWIFERDLFGQILPSIEVDSLKLYRYTGVGGLITLIIEGFTLLIGLIQLCKTVILGIKQRKLPSIFLVLSLLTFMTAIALYIWRTIIGLKTVETVMNSRDKIIDFSKFFASDKYFILFIGLSAFFAQIHLLEILKISRNISILATILTKTKELLLNLLICYIAFLIGSSFFGLIVFGPKLNNYKTLIASAISLFRTLFGKLSFDSIEAESGLYGKIFIIIYAFLIHYVATNFLITILNDILKKVKSKKTKTGYDEELYKYIGELFNRLFKKPKDTKNSKNKYIIKDEPLVLIKQLKKEKVKEEDRYDIRNSLTNNDHLNDLIKRLDEILKYLNNCLKVQAEGELKTLFMKHSLKNCVEVENIQLVVK
ncbi:DgyrCDS12788 [Dimorphilus gyrociliatus]|uniref:DgyrCDS12788 n=1 Tax=Dimorphilus gyrociliatus TaxID=2664684 RepID=A0A7I8W8R3_9ANNE|nr:DgyrCDS12788 [Dimorphilus gyrociliatus]